jgi:hypothetical protein
MSTLDGVTALLSGLYVCRRNWAAWEVGTMGADDFARASHDADTVDEAIGLLATLRAERDAALTERDRLRAEKDALRANYSDLHPRINVQCYRAEDAENEVARLRAVIAEAAADLPLHPEGAHLTPPEADAEEVRQALLAALRGEA